jgi:hypothetical protein
VIVTTATVLWLFSLPTLVHGEAANPYSGILLFLMLPGAFLAGLLLIPLGLWWARRHAPLSASVGPLSFDNPKLRRLLYFVLVTTFVNLMIASQFGYSAVSYMDSVGFCGQTCHTVMQPEFAAYQNSPHSRVECVKCHIGPGASWFVKSKLSGAWQVIAVTFNTYPRPIPAPVENLRPARETCEACHWPQKFGSERLRVIHKYADDEANTLSRSVLLMRIGGGGAAGAGIHTAHIAEGIQIRYAHSDPKRQNVPWVEVTKNGAQPVVYQAPDVKGDAIKDMPVRVMDCMDCHNRPTHAYEMPERAIDQAMWKRQIDPALPFIKKKGLELLKKTYSGHAEAAQAIPAGLEDYYKTSHAPVYESRKKEIAQASQALLSIYTRNVFPEMKVEWGTYPNHIGHTDFPGCFRCHDEVKVNSEKKTITQDCNTCHSLLAMDEAAPKILDDLGLK